MSETLNFPKTVSSKLQKKINTSIIFNYIRKNSPVTRAGIVKVLKISAPAVSRVIEKLIKNGDVIETVKAETKSGKKPVLLIVNVNEGFVIGIDLGKKRFKAIVSNFNGEIIERFNSFKITNNRDIDRKLILEINNILKELENKKIFNRDKLKAICIGIPASIDVESGKTIDAPLYANWKDLNLKKNVEEEFNVPVLIENDVNLSAIGEKHYGKGKDYKDFVFVEISNGIGAGIVIDNHLFRGSYGSAGEIAYSIISSNYLGNKKDEEALENIASLEGIKSTVLKKISNNAKTSILDIVNNDLNKIDSSTIFKAAVSGDVLANDIIKNMINFLTISLINLILILNPQLLIIGGDIVSLPEVNKLLIEPLKEKIKKSLVLDIPEIDISSLGQNAGVIGASFHAIESLIMKKYPYKIEKELS